MAERFSCALRSRVLGEPCYGTASQVRRWILVEQPGGWGSNAVLQSRLPQDIAVRLRAAARSIGARLLLIRRHGRSAPDRRTCYAAVSTAGVRRIERFQFDDPADLVTIDWSPLRDLAPLGGDVVEQLYLVCTNGSHDVCCAEFGRPVAQVLDNALGDRVWEVSHIGGDRFAGNLVCLPDGVYYGRVQPKDALRVVRQHEAGEVDLNLYRGRSYFPFVAQAAEHFVRDARRMTRLDDIVSHMVERLDGGLFRVTIVTSTDEAITATVECSEAIDPQQLTCSAGTEEHPPRYTLVSLD